MKLTEEVIRYDRSRWALCLVLGSLTIGACAQPSLGAEPSAGGDAVTSPPPGDASTTTPAADAAPAAPNRLPDAGSADAWQTFTVGASDCNGGHCRAGYNGVKDETELGTASSQCVSHGLARATAFTLSDEKPGGKFCSFANGTYKCDNSCSGCNPIGTINCVTP